MESAPTSPVPSRKKFTYGKAATGKKFSWGSIFLKLAFPVVILVQIHTLYFLRGDCFGGFEEEGMISTAMKSFESKTPKRHKSPNYSFDTIPSRTWQFYEHPFPCYPSETKILLPVTPTHEGILFQRPTKVGSTTMTNIVLRMVHKRAAAQLQQLENATDPSENKELIEKWKKSKAPFCNFRAMHGTSVSFEFPQRNKNKSFLFSLVRDPTKRAISEFFHFAVTTVPKDPTDMNFVAYATRPRNSNHNVRFLTFDESLPLKMSAEYENFLRDYTPPENNGHGPPLTRKTINVVPSDYKVAPLNYTQIVQEILDSYEFIAVTERMNESLVAMKILLGLSVEEILYAKASRSAGAFSNGPKGRPCMYLIPGFVSKGMNDFFYTPGKNDQWLAYTKGDALLHKAASRSLDRTIEEVIGRERFARELKEFENALAYAQAICSSEPGLVTGMCDEGGNVIQHKDSTCYIWAEGCDHKCLNERVPHPIPKAVLDGTQKYEK